MKVNVNIEVSENDDTIDVTSLLKEIKKVKDSIYSGSTENFIVNIKGKFRC